jgi:hypothetical protein
MDDVLRTTATAILDAMPCSIELPAGGGKTQHVAALATVATGRGDRPLVLTHTNAGVDVLRRRLRGFGVDGASVRIDTIASWSWGLIRRYPRLSGVAVTEEPEWDKSRQYYAGAISAVDTTAITAVLEASYGLVIVDEYQDCVVEQHDLIVALGKTLPVCVFGDRLQCIFNFGQNVTVAWEPDVLKRWQAFPVPTEPWRWKGHNEPLGQWLISIRPQLLAGQPINLLDAPLNWRSSKDAPQEAIRACYSIANADGSVVAIGQFDKDCAYVAGKTNGIYSMMEELEGKFMLAFARTVDRSDCRAIAAATREFAKHCISGVAAKLNKLVADKLAKGESVTKLKRPGAERQLELLTGLLTDASPGRVAETLEVIGQMPEGRPYRREAWRDMVSALKIAEVSNGVTVTQALSRIRNRTRFSGRGHDSRIISRPLLIKGLEYDHALVLNAERLSPAELYVALSRGRKSLTVVSESRHLKPKTSNRQAA